MAAATTISWYRILAVLALLAAAPAKDRRRYADPPKLPPETMQVVELVLDTPVAELEPAWIEPFMAVDDAKLPVEIWAEYCARKTELMALRSVANERGRPPVRRLDQPVKSQCPEEKITDACAKKLKTGNYGLEEIAEEEALALQKQTNCTECELQEEFSLQVKLVPGKAKGPKARMTKKYYLHPNDPLWAIVARLRESKDTAGGTDFFSSGVRPACR